MTSLSLGLQCFAVRINELPSSRDKTALHDIEFALPQICAFALFVFFPQRRGKRVVACPIARQVLLTFIKTSSLLHTVRDAESHHQTNSDELPSLAHVGCLLAAGVQLRIYKWWMTTDGV